MEFSLQQYHQMITDLQNDNNSMGDRLLIIPANEMIADIDYRITQEGKDSDNNKIGDYSKKPYFATAASFDNQDNFKPKRKKSGKGIRTSIDLEEGYYELRKIQGYGNDFVNLERTGDGIKNIKSAKEDENTALIGFTDIDESNKFRWYEKGHNATHQEKTILSPTKEEIQRYKEAQIREMRSIIKEAFTP